MSRRSIAICLMLACILTSTVLADEATKSAESKSTESVWVTSIAPLGTSSQFVAATADGLLLREATVYSFDASNPNQRTAIYSHPAAVWCVDVTTDGSHVASVDYRGNLVVFGTKDAKATTHEKAFERWCQAMLISPDNKTILAGNEAGKVMIWDLEAKKVTQSAELEGHAVTGLAFSPDGTRVAASDGGGQVHLLKWPSLESEGKIKVSEETAWCVTFVEKGQKLLVGSSDRHVYKCDAKADAKPESVVKGTDWITQLAVSPGGQVAAAEVGGRLHFPSTGGTDSMEATSGVWSLCWNGDSQLFAGTRKDGIVMAGQSWKWTQPKPPEPKPEPKAEPAAEKAEMKSEAKSEAKSGKKAEEKKEAKPEKKAEPKKEAKDKSKADAKPKDDKPADAKPKADAKAEKADSKPSKDAKETKAAEKSE